MTNSDSRSDTLSISRIELIAILGMLMATVALAVDGMLPAMDLMSRDLAPGGDSPIGLVIACFVFGLGVGTFVTGPLSDAYGRKPVILCGAMLFIACSIWCAVAQSMEQVLIARVIQGLAASAPRVCAISISRDLFSGREMARMTSYVMIVFNIIPAIAPTIGALVMFLAGWRAIFVGFAVFGLVTTIWFMARLPETHGPEARRPIRIGQIMASVREVFSYKVTLYALSVISLCYGSLFSSLSVTQPIFEGVYDRGDSFHLWFGLISFVSASASLANATLVMKFGMRPIVRTVLRLLLGYCVVVLGAIAVGAGPGVMFPLFVGLQLFIFVMAGMCIGNLTALALEPMGKMAGLAASVNAAISTIMGAAIAAITSYAFNGTLLPLVVCVAVCTALGAWIMATMPREAAKDAGN